MAETVTNLKVRFGAETKQFKQDLDSGKAAVDNFAGAAKNSFSEFASLFGVNMDAITSGVSTANKSLALLSGGFKGATVASGGFSAALKILRIALISTGIGAIVVALGALVSYFTQTERGAEAVERAMASLKAIFKVVTDQASALGEVIADAFTNPKQTVLELWEFIKSQFVNRITAIPRVIEAAWNLVKGIFSGGLKDAAAEYASALTQLGTGLDKTQQGKVVDYFKAVGTEMKNEAAQAWDLQKALQVLEDREIALIEVQEKRRRQVSELRLAAKEEGLAAAEKLKLLDQAANLQRQITADDLSLQKERVRILEQQISMGEVMDEDTRKLAEAKADLNRIEATGLDNIRALTRERNSAVKAIEAESEAIMKARLEQSKDLKPIQSIQVKGPVTDQLETSKLETSAAKIKTIYGDLKSEVMDFSQIFTDSMNNVAVGFGESLGNMLAGAGGLSDLGAFVGQTLGDMAVQVGKVAIQTGIGMIAIKNSFKNPYTAIAAGIALVALGSFIKSSLSNAMSGSSSGSFSAASSGGGDTGTGSLSSPSNLRSAPLTINIVGTLRAQGKELVAVIDKANQRTAITT